MQGSGCVIYNSVLCFAESYWLKGLLEGLKAFRSAVTTGVETDGH